MTPQDGPAEYIVDPKASQLTVQALASGLIAAVAHSPRIAIRQWTSSVKFDPETLADAKVRMQVDTRSFEVLDDLKENERREIHRVMNDEVLESKKYPDVLFESTNVAAERLRESLYRVNVDGFLTLHGVTNRHAFYSQVAFGVDSFRAHGEFTLLQTDYEIRIASVAGGTLKLQDELKFRFYAVGRRVADK
jgi:polyisoprenoid-binding protein YceI